jgi:hypothetical protein
MFGFRNRQIFRGGRNIVTILTILTIQARPAPPRYVSTGITLPLSPDTASAEVGYENGLIRRFAVGHGKSTHDQTHSGSLYIDGSLCRHGSLGCVVL